MNHALKVFLMLKIFKAALLCLLPWRLKRFIYVRIYGYKIHKTARIGFSLIMANKLILSEGSRIGNLTLVKGLDTLDLGSFAKLGNLNWITGFPVNKKSIHFSDQVDRNPSLYIGNHSAVTNRHLIDCTAQIVIGEYSTFAGFGSQILTHSIDIKENRQRAKPVTVGNYCFIGTGCILLGGSQLPNNSILGAGAVLNKFQGETFMLYAGVPAEAVKSLESNLKYFNREVGFVI